MSRWSAGSRRRVARRLRLARYWQVHDDLDEAARHAYRALQAVATCALPVPLTAEVARTVARIERDRDHADVSHRYLRYAVDLLEPAPGSAERDRLLVLALVDLGDCHRRAGRYRLARRVLHRALRLAEAADPPVPEPLTAALTMLGIVAKELGRYDEAAHWYGRVATIHGRLGVLPADAAALQHNLAGLAYARHRYAEAESHARRAVALRRRSKAATKIDVAADQAVLATAVAAQNRRGEARDLLQHCLAVCRAARPPRRYEIAVLLHNLAAIDQVDNRLADAERRYREALAGKELLLGPDHPEVGLVVNNLGTVLADLDRPDEALACYRRALAIAERTLPPNHPVTGAIRDNLDRIVPNGRA